MTFPLMPQGSVYSPALEATYLGGYATGLNRTTYTSGTISFGAEHPTREIFVVLTYGQTTGPTVVASATIGGVSATIHRNQRYCLISAHIPTGASGTVSVTLSAQSSQMTLAAFRLINRRSLNAPPTSSISIGSSFVLTSTTNHTYPINSVGLLSALSLRQSGSEELITTLSPPYTKVQRYTESFSAGDGDVTYADNEIYCGYLLPKVNATSSQALTVSFNRTAAYGGYLFIIE